MIYELSGEIIQDKAKCIRLSQFRSHEITAITGAGISVESGLPLGTEAVGGLPLTTFFRPEVWSRHAKLGFRVYRTMLYEWRDKKPNLAHQVLSRVDIPVITQNIDGLHRDAGSRNVIELHGNLRELICKNCFSTFDSSLAFKSDIPICPSCGLMLHPGIILEGEPVRHIARAIEWIASSSCILVIGTQLEMDPVRQLYVVARRRGIIVVWITARAEDWLSLLFEGF